MDDVLKKRIEDLLQEIIDESESEDSHETALRVIDWSEEAVEILKEMKTK